MQRNVILHGDVLEQLKTLPRESVHMVVTSPPYWGLRDYGVDGQLGMEADVRDYISHIVLIFREVRRVLRSDGTLWLNMGDCYTSGKRVPQEALEAGGKRRSNNQSRCVASFRRDQRPREDDPKKSSDGLKPKDLVGQPWRVALALQADGWYLRQDIIWAKKNSMPESVKDRPSKSHEYLFLFSKSEKYYYDWYAIAEPTSGTAHSRGSGVNPKAKIPSGWDTSKGNGSTHHSGASRYKQDGHGRRHEGFNARCKQNASFSAAIKDIVYIKNKRSVWPLSTVPFSGAHFATFPPKLIEPCILAGTSAHGCCPLCSSPYFRVLSKVKIKPVDYQGKNLTQDPQYSHRRILACTKGAREAGLGESHDNPFPQFEFKGWRRSCKCTLDAGDLEKALVMDPFMGSGTTAGVALFHGRDWIGTELSGDYIKLMPLRIEHVRKSLEKQRAQDLQRPLTRRPDAVHAGAD